MRGNKMEQQLNLQGEQINKWGQVVPPREPREEFWTAPKGETTLLVNLAEQPKKLETKFGTRYLLKIDVVENKDPEELSCKQWLVSEFMLQNILEVLQKKESNKLRLLRLGEGKDTKYEVM